MRKLVSNIALPLMLTTISATLFRAGAEDDEAAKSVKSKLSVQVGSGKRTPQKTSDTFAAPVTWPHAMVPYSLAQNLQENETDTIVEVLTDLERLTCLNFTSRIFEKNYTLFTRGPACASNVGMSGKRQYVFLSGACFTFSRIARQLMHVLGFHSELNRPDRDEYVEINWPNIKPGFSRSFLKYLPAAYLSLDFPFDFESVSHFDGTKFAVDPDEWTVRAKNHTVQSVGSGESFSKWDIAKINRMYCPVKEKDM